MKLFDTMECGQAFRFERLVMETDYVEYTCYDANGTVVQKATTIYIGCIDTKKHPSKTFTFDVPATTAEVRITKSKIVYWTEWS